MLFVIETEFTYWFAALRAYFLHLDNTYDAKPLNGGSKKQSSSSGGNKGMVTKDSFLTDWSDQDFLDTLILAGMFIKKKLLQAQTFKFEQDRQRQSSQMFIRTQCQVNEKIQKSRNIQDKNHQIIVEDSQNEIESIEQNIITFRHTEDYYIKYKYFEQLMIGPHIQFSIGNITLKQINNLFNLLNGKSSDESKTELASKKLEDMDQKVGGLLGKRNYQEDIDAICDEANQISLKAQKRDPAMVSYIEW